MQKVRYLMSVIFETYVLSVTVAWQAPTLSGVGSNPTGRALKLSLCLTTGKDTVVFERFAVNVRSGTAWSLVLSYNGKYVRFSI